MINPFSSEFVKPDARRFQFGKNEAEAGKLLDRWVGAGRIGQIRGPHGSGKSTLIATLLADSYFEERLVRHVKLADRASHWEIQQIVPVNALSSDFDTLIIDGFEQLNLLSKISLVSYCLRKKRGLIVTCHRHQIGIPRLFRTNPDISVFLESVVELQRSVNSGERLVTQEEATESFRRFSGNMRDAYFELYDIYYERYRARKELQRTELTAS